MEAPETALASRRLPANAVQRRGDLFSPSMRRPTAEGTRRRCAMLGAACALAACGGGSHGGETADAGAPRDATTEAAPVEAGAESSVPEAAPDAARDGGAPDATPADDGPGEASADAPIDGPVDVGATDAPEGGSPAGDAGCDGSSAVSFGAMQVLSFPDIGLASSLVAGDVNGDGRNDLVMLEDDLSNNQQTVLVFLQDATGAFPADAVAGPGPTDGAWAVADVNGDGRVDIVQGASAAITVRLGQTDGTFASPVTYPIGDGFAQPGLLLTGDFSHDGRTDVLSSSSGTIFLWTQTSTGALTGPMTLTGGYGAVGDVNGDGLPDIAGLGTAQNVTSIYVTPGATTGYFGAEVTWPFNGADMLSWGGVVAADVTGDGKDDLIVANDQNNPGSALLVSVQQAGVLQPPASYPSGDVAGAVAVVDVTGDCRNDVIVQHPGWSSVGVYAQQANGTLAAEVKLTSVYGEDVLAVADLDGDGKPDIAVADQQKLVVFHNTR
jgi:FG-GAP-like repeat